MTEKEVVLILLVATLPLALADSPPEVDPFVQLAVPSDGAVDVPIEIAPMAVIDRGSRDVRPPYEVALRVTGSEEDVWSDTLDAAQELDLWRVLADFGPVGLVPDTSYDMTVSYGVLDHDGSIVRREEVLTFQTGGQSLSAMPDEAPLLSDVAVVYQPSTEQFTVRATLEPLSPDGRWSTFTLRTPVQAQPLRSFDPSNSYAWSFLGLEAETVNLRFEERDGLGNWSTGEILSVPVTELERGGCAVAPGSWLSLWLLAVLPLRRRARGTR